MGEGWFAVCGRNSPEDIPGLKEGVQGMEICLVEESTAESFTKTVNEKLKEGFEPDMGMLSSSNSFFMKEAGGLVYYFMLLVKDVDGDAGPDSGDHRV